VIASGAGEQWNACSEAKSKTCNPLSDAPCFTDLLLLLFIACNDLVV
jgi:hypothetical protein